MTEQAVGRELYAGLDLLDRQIIDCDGCMAGKVDDLELELAPDPGALPVVTAILSGPGALARQLGGRLGRWLESVQERLHHRESPGPARVPFSVVKRINDHVEVTVPRDALESDEAEKWAREVIVGKIPGSGHAPE